MREQEKRSKEVYVKSVSYNIKTGEGFVFWTDGTIYGQVGATRKETRFLCHYGTFPDPKKIGEEVRYSTEKDWIKVSISSIAQLNNKTWIASWTNAGIKGEFKITQAEADQLIAVPGFTRGKTGSTDLYLLGIKN